MGGKATGEKLFDLEYAQSIAEKIQKELSEISIKSEIAGSIRRKKTQVRDVDIVVLWSERADEYCRLKWGLQKNGKPKRSGIVDEITVELYPATEDSWGPSLQTWTGSKEFNISLRAKAKRMGCMLSQNGFKDKEGKLIAFKTEQEMFEYLEEPYLEPSQRN